MPKTSVTPLAASVSTRASDGVMRCGLLAVTADLRLGGGGRAAGAAPAGDENDNPRPRRSNPDLPNERYPTRLMLRTTTGRLVRDTPHIGA